MVVCSFLSPKPQILHTRPVISTHTQAEDRQCHLPGLRLEPHMRTAFLAVKLGLRSKASGLSISRGCLMVAKTFRDLGLFCQQGKVSVLRIP